MRTLMTTLAALTIIVVVSIPQQAEAKGMIFFYQTGEDLFPSGPIPAPFDKVPSLQNMKAGYKCRIFGLFWAYVARWDCMPVAFISAASRKFMRPNAALAKAIEQKYKGKYGGGFWKLHGRWILALILIGSIVMGAFRKKMMGGGGGKRGGKRGRGGPGGPGGGGGGGE